MPRVLPIRIAGARDVRAFSRFVERHLAENGKDGSPVFAPMISAKREEVETAALGRWEKALEEIGWGRSFLLLDGPDVVGQLELKGGRIAAELHRATLAMGILRPHTGRGEGRRLVETAVAWAREHGLDWIDLGVFDGNGPARRLYERTGFREIGTRDDAFRLPDGTVIRDILMAKDLRDGT